MTPIKFTVYGQPVSMKNGREIVRNKRTGKPISIKSKEARQYVSDFLIQIPYRYKIKIDVPVKVTIRAYYTSMRPDLDCELIYDCLQKGGVLKNDRLIEDKHSQRRVDKENPRCEITIRHSHFRTFKFSLKKKEIYVRRNRNDGN